jgi:hypothetical protein
MTDNQNLNRMDEIKDIQILHLLKKELLTFLDELIAILPQEKDFLVMRFFIKDQVPILDVMNYIIRELVPLEKYVLEKNDKFFLEHQVLFEPLRDEASKVNYFKGLWENHDMHENKDIIWNWFKHFIDLAKKFNSLGKV